MPTRLRRCLQVVAFIVCSVNESIAGLNQPHVGAKGEAEVLSATTKAIAYADLAKSPTNGTLYGALSTLLGPAEIDSVWAAIQLRLWGHNELLELGWWRSQNSTVRTVTVALLIDLEGLDGMDRLLRDLEGQCGRFREPEASVRKSELGLARNTAARIAKQVRSAHLKDAPDNPPKCP